MYDYTIEHGVMKFGVMTPFREWEIITDWTHCL